ncbi:MAG: hypothetical protein CMK89_12185 [Pseudomonadales bacterium]|nr:hypothetical protein [Pseudomonadales bacterium]
MYIEMLEELIALLRKAEADHRAEWFSLAKKYYIDGKHEKSYRKVLGAYGGMGSFNDVYWRLPQNDEQRQDFLKDEIRKYAKNELELL